MSPPSPSANTTIFLASASGISTKGPGIRPSPEWNPSPCRSSPHKSGSRVSGSPFLSYFIAPLSLQMIEERPHRPLFCLPNYPVEYKSLTYRKLRIFVCSNLTGHFLTTNYQSITSIQRAGRQVQLNGAFSPNSRTSAVPIGIQNAPPRAPRAMAHRNYPHSARKRHLGAAVWRIALSRTSFKVILIG